LDISKAIDKAAGAEREVIGESMGASNLGAGSSGDYVVSHSDPGKASVFITAPATPEAQQWDGWGSALKPSFEPIVLARKPLAGTIASTVLEYGTGGLNIDGCRVESGDDYHGLNVTQGGDHFSVGSEAKTRGTKFEPAVGRWPPNILLSPETAAKLGGKASYFPVFDYGDEDRFFYAPKASREEREAGCEHLPGRTAAETVDREPGSAGASNPRAGAGRENGKESGVEVRNFHPT
jgi:site-specific DNA-methyltransferase (adenine-specific)